MNDHRATRTNAPEHRPGTRLWAIVYVSKAAREVTRGDLLRILESARRRNAEAHITGLLLHADGSFMQYLEGPAVELFKVYALIKADPLHYGLVDLVREPIQTREFAEWSMACHAVGAAAGAPLTENYALLAGRLTASLRPRSAACELLSSFWTEGRDAVASALRSYGRLLAERRTLADVDTLSWR